MQLHAHHLRELTGVAQTLGQHLVTSPTQIADLLGETSSAVTTGTQGRPKLGAAGSPVRRLDLYPDHVLRFPTDFPVLFDNHQAKTRRHN